MPLHDSNLASLLPRRWRMEETWAVPQPFLDHFVGGYLFCGVIHMLFQGERFCLPKCFWSLCKPSCQPKCSHTCTHCYSHHLAVNAVPIAPRRARCARLSNMKPIMSRLSASNSSSTQMTMGYPIRSVILSSSVYWSTINVSATTHEKRSS